MRTTVVCFCALILFTAGPAHATEQRKDEEQPCAGESARPLLRSLAALQSREIPLNVIVPDAGSMPLPATWISGRLLVGYGGFVENQNPRLNYKQYLMLTVEKGRITKREFQDRKLWIQ